MGLIAPRDDSFDIIGLCPVKKLIGINPMGLSAPWDDSLYNIFLDTVKQIARG